MTLAPPWPQNSPSAHQTGPPMATELTLSAPNSRKLAPPWPQNSPSVHQTAGNWPPHGHRTHPQRTKQQETGPPMATELTLSAPNSRKLAPPWPQNSPSVHQTAGNWPPHGHRTHPQRTKQQETAPPMATELTLSAPNSRKLAPPWPQNSPSVHQTAGNWPPHGHRTHPQRTKQQELAPPMATELTLSAPNSRKLPPPWPQNSPSAHQTAGNWPPHGQRTHPRRTKQQETGPPMAAELTLRAPNSRKLAPPNGHRTHPQRTKQQETAPPQWPQNSPSAHRTAGNWPLHGHRTHPQRTKQQETGPPWQETGPSMATELTLSAPNSRKLAPPMATELTLSAPNSRTLAPPNDRRTHPQSAKQQENGQRQRGKQSEKCTRRLL